MPNPKEVAALLKSGKNVVTPLGWFWPTDAERSRMEPHCLAGGVTLHGTGIDPGGATEQQPLFFSGLSSAITYVRGNRRRLDHAVPLDEELHDQADGNAADHESDQQVRALHRFIHAQEPLNRALLLLYLEDRSYREMAEVLGISETNVATKISRLKQRIRNEI
jgi:hypothetical protein